MPHLMTQREVAELLRCSERQVSRYRASGRLPFQKLDNGVRIRREHAEALLSTPTPSTPQRSWTATRWTDDAAELPELDHKGAEPKGRSVNVEREADLAKLRRYASPLEHDDERLRDRAVSLLRNSSTVGRGRPAVRARRMNER